MTVGPWSLSERVRRWPAWPETSLLLLALAAFGQTLTYPFLWDDELYIAANPYLAHWRDAFKLFATDMERTGAAGGYYRPLQAVSYLVNFQVSGLNPWSYHLANILLHALAAILLFRLFAWLLSRRDLAWAAAALWLVHPLQTEAVAYVAGRNDPLSACFGVSGLLLHWRSLRDDGRRLNGWAAAAALCFAAALFSRESAFTLLLSASLLEVLLRRPIPWKGLIARALLYGSGLAAYALARGMALAPAAGATPRAPHPQGALAYPLALFDGLRLVLWPYPIYHQRPAAGLGPGGALAGWLALAVAAVGLVALWRSKDRALQVPALFYAAGLLVALPAAWLSQLFLPHWLYLPSFGAVFAVLLLGQRLVDRLGLKHPGAAKAGIVALCLAVLTALTVRSNTVWSGPTTLFRHIVRHAPNSGIAWDNLGLSYLAEGNFDLAEGALLAASRLGDDPDTTAGLALLRHFQGRNEEALRLFDGLLDDPRRRPRARWLNNRAAVLLALGRKDRALADVRRATDLEPLSHDSWFNLGFVLSEAGRAEEARRAWEAAARLRFEPTVALARAGAAANAGDLPGALEVLQRVRRAGPPDANVLVMIGLVQVRGGDLRAAKETWSEGLARFPDNGALRSNLERLAQVEGAATPGR